MNSTLIVAIALLIIAAVIAVYYTLPTTLQRPIPPEFNEINGLTEEIELPDLNTELNFPEFEEINLPESI